MTARQETEQEAFWRGAFGNDYATRNASDRLLASNVALFARILRSAPGIGSVVELGCNVGMNLKALSQINPGLRLCAYEINQEAAQAARQLGLAEIREQSILTPELGGGETYDLSFTKGVLIHLDPQDLGLAYKNLVNLSNNYVLVVEYYNPAPVAVEYRGHRNKLFKRDFAGELLDQFDLELVDYGFAYRRDNYFPQDDLTWFLLRRRIGRPRGGKAPLTAAP